MVSDNATGADQLTPREREILDLVSDGCSNREIAELLGIRKATVRFHIKEIHARLGSGGSRESLRDLNEGSSRAVSLIGGLVAIGSAAVVGISALVFVMQNTGEPVDGAGVPGLAWSGEAACTMNLSAAGNQLNDDGCEGPANSE